MNFSPGPFREDPERTSGSSRPGGPTAAARTPAALLAAASVTGARRKPRSFPGKFAVTLWEFPGRAPRRWLWSRGLVKARGDAAALGGVSRSGVHRAPLGSGASQAEVPHILVLIPLPRAASARRSTLTLPDFPVCRTGRIVRTSLKLTSNDQLRGNGLGSLPLPRPGATESHRTLCS